MNEPIAQAVEKLVGGDLSTGSFVYVQPHDQLLAACQDKRLVVTRQAAATVLRDLSAGKVTGPEAQAWASFIRHGYVAGGRGPVRPLPIDYESEFEDAIVEAISRMDEIGDVVDGELDRDEIEGLLEELEAGARP